MSGLQDMSLEEFLQHRGNAPRGQFLDGWKEKGFLHAWLHRKRPFASMWQHRLPVIDIKEDELRQCKRVVTTRGFSCGEEESVLRDQYRRDKETGQRTSPPESCSICRMVEHVHQCVIRGELHWLAPIFDFDTGDPQRRVIIRASGMWNGYKPDRLNDSQKSEMEEAGISPKYGWKENCQAQLNYVLCIVDDDDLSKGVQIMKEGMALGDKVKLAIAKEMKRHPKNPSMGNPILHPYAFRFEYASEATPDKKYEAFRVDLDLRPEVMTLITETAPPDLSMFTGSFSRATLRAQLESAALVELPWDELFPPEEDEEPKKAPVRASAPASAGACAASACPCATAQGGDVRVRRVFRADCSDGDIVPALRNGLRGRGCTGAALSAPASEAERSDEACGVEIGVGSTASSAGSTASSAGSTASSAGSTASSAGSATSVGSRDDCTDRRCCDGCC